MIVLYLECLCFVCRNYITTCRLIKGCQLLHSSEKRNLNVQKIRYYNVSLIRFLNVCEKRYSNVSEKRNLNVQKIRYYNVCIKTFAKNLILTLRRNVIRMWEIMLCFFEQRQKKKKRFCKTPLWQFKNTLLHIASITFTKLLIKLSIWKNEKKNWRSWMFLHYP